MSFDVHANDSLAHYARACTDVLFTFPFGTQVRGPGVGPGVWTRGCGHGGGGPGRGACVTGRATPSRCTPPRPPPPRTAPQELQGCAARGNFDLTAHATASGKSMEYYDEVAPSARHQARHNRRQRAEVTPHLTVPVADAPWPTLATDEFQLFRLFQLPVHFALSHSATRWPPTLVALDDEFNFISPLSAEVSSLTGGAKVWTNL